MLEFVVLEFVLDVLDAWGVFEISPLLIVCNATVYACSSMSFSFFNEPVYLALFYTVNVFLIAPSLKKSKVFLIANVVGGVLTFSYLFFILSLIFIFSKKIAAHPIKEYSFLLLVAAGLIILATQIDLFSSSSLADRWERANFFLKAMEDSNIFQLIFGHGFARETGFDNGFSAGLFTMIYEIGIVNLIVIFIFVLKILSKKSYIFLVLCIPLLIFEPVKLPLFWILVIVLTVFERLEGPHKRLGKVG